MKSTPIFLDTEFTGLHQNAKLISMALVSISGEIFYAEFNDYEIENLDTCVQEDVIKNLQFNHTESFIQKEKGKWQIKSDQDGVQKLLTEWLDQFELIEIWADVLAYDWVLFCELFGGALYLPDNIFFAPFDLSTLFKINGLINPQGKYTGDFNRAAFVEKDDKFQHNALNDAKISLECYKKLIDL